MSQLPTFGINGFGRIGRTAFRVWWQYYRDKAVLKAVNTSGSMELESWVHLLTHDTNYGRWQPQLTVNKLSSVKELKESEILLGQIELTAEDGQKYSVAITAQREPSLITWEQLGVETVIESTGKFVSNEAASQHLQGGAQRVIISAPPKGGAVSTTVLGVNQDKATGTIHSNASCTTNCVAPVAQIMHDTFGVEKAMLTTIHSYTDDQNTHDNSHKDLRRARAAAENIIPTSTGAAIATTEIIPELKGLFDGLAVRVPTPTGSLSDMVFVTKRPTSIEEVNQTFIEAAKQPRWQGILAVTDAPIVSSDIKGRTESSIVDLSLTNVIDGNLVKVISWYDNEWGYCCRLIEQVAALSKL